MGMREQPVLIAHTERGNIRFTGQWSEGDAVFTGFYWLSFDQLEAVIDGQTVPVNTNVSVLSPQDTVTIPTFNLV